jgi:hypothetical protein
MSEKKNTGPNGENADEESQDHLLEDLIERYPAIGGDEAAEAEQERTWQLLRVLAEYLVDNPNEPVPLSVATELAEPLVAYLYAHGRAGGLEKRVTLDEKALQKSRDLVETGREYHLDHALGLVTPPFQGAPKKYRHRNETLFLIAFCEHELADRAETQISVLRRAARVVGLRGYTDENLSHEYGRWRENNKHWLMEYFST